MEPARETNFERSKKAFAAIAHKLEEATRNDVYTYIHEVDEWGLGIETMIDFLAEEGISLSSEEMKLLSEAANSMAIERGIHSIRVAN